VAKFVSLQTHYHKFISSSPLFIAHHKEEKIKLHKYHKELKRTLETPNIQIKKSTEKRRNKEM